MECDKCTLCCKLLETHDVPSPIEEYCIHCKPNKGCKIHATRPKECSTYQCMWSQMVNSGEELRPDRCNIIFDRISDDVISARLEKGKKIEDLVFGQINSFVNEGFSVLVFRDKEKKFFLSKSHTKEYVLGKVNDHSQLH